MQNVWIFLFSYFTSTICVYVVSYMRHIALEKGLFRKIGCVWERGNKYNTENASPEKKATISDNNKNKKLCSNLRHVPICSLLFMIFVLQQNEENVQYLSTHQCRVN